MSELTQKFVEEALLLPIEDRTELVEKIIAKS